MNLLRGFITQADCQPDLSDLELKLQQQDLSGEPDLADMLVDPVMVSMMNRDGVRPADIIRLYRCHERAAA